MTAPEMWTLSFVHTRELPELAVRTERHGWDGLLAADSQNLTGDPYAALAVAATRTSRLLLGTGVTNPVTRHPAAAAAAAATVQDYSGGRMVLGIGRGDSALAQLGRGPEKVAAFERYVARLQGFLAGESVDLDGFGSRLAWLDGSELPKVPVDVAATGPKAIAVGARLADRVTFTVGADPERLRWCVETARKARADAGLDPEGIRLGAYVNAVTHPDRAVAAELVRGSLSVFARFSGMQLSGMQRAGGTGMATGDESVVRAVTSAYDIHGHANAGAGHTGELSRDFTERFAIIGPPEYCVERLRPLLGLGLSHLVIAGHSRDADPGLLDEASEAFGREVIPHLG